MCTLKTWYAGADGSIRQCRDCNCFQGVFGATMFSLEASRFKAFIDLVAFRRRELIPVDEELRYIILPIPHSCAAMILNESELRFLDALLQHTENEIMAARLLDLFDMDKSR